jgi:hypothetical protein
MVETWIELIGRELELDHPAAVAVCAPPEDEPQAPSAPAEELP